MVYGENIYLRDPVREDIDILYDICADKEVLKYNGLYTGIMTKEYIRSQFHHFTKPNKKELVIVTKDSDMIGYVYYKENSYTRDVYSIGITIGKGYWGNGYGKDSIRTLCNYLFNKRKAHKIELEVVKENIRAINCYKKCGFKEEGIRRSKYYIGGKYLDTIVMGLLKEEFIQYIGE
ncbi:MULTISPECIES: GNAT family protein [Clostridium]|jgi:diamine N-acetyltransferase|uniref:N-acetyltransferase GCN5 n=2 Tax=root TaxID=1 RepID=R9CBW0_9CLOT|nr:MULTISPECIES: GNAT family protein [Clostridium]EOR26515.1 N-acetyltransferase GCN5 [Clostridium sartagoforme AAU1]KLE16206.1 GCN5 family acetyltransferase [Clostridium sp. C8]